MSHTIGAVTLPNGLTDAIPRFRKLSQEVPFYVMQPLISDLGARVPILALKGYMIGDSIEALYTSHVNTLKSYIVGPAKFPAIILDEAPATDWIAFDAGVGHYTIAVANTATRHVTGAQSLGITVTHTGADHADVGFRRTYVTSQNFSAQEFVSWCWRGGGVTDNWDLIFTDADGDTMTYNFTDPAAGIWARYVIRKGLFTDSATFDWTNVDTVEFKCTPTGATRINYADRVCIGVGQYVDFPGARYDGIYLVLDAQFPEKGGIVRVLPFTMELAKSDDFYGIIANAV